MEIKVDALVLRTADFGENDKMLTLFSLQYGKISAAIRGVRKAGAKLRFAAQPFCFAEYVLAKRGERNTVVSASLTDGFYALREDIGKFYAAACVTGVADAVLYGGIVNEELFLRAVAARSNFRDICSPSTPAPAAAPRWKGASFSTWQAAVFPVRNAPRARGRAFPPSTYCASARARRTIPPWLTKTAFSAPSGCSSPILPKRRRRASRRWANIWRCLPRVERSPLRESFVAL